MELSAFTKYRMQQVVDMIDATPEKFTMTTLSERPEARLTLLPTEGTCDTVGCIAGYAESLYLNAIWRTRRAEGLYYQADFVQRFATEKNANYFLGLTIAQGNQLYYLKAGGANNPSLWIKYKDNPIFKQKEKPFNNQWFTPGVVDGSKVRTYPNYPAVSHEDATKMLLGLIDGTFDFLPANS